MGRHAKSKSLRKEKTLEEKIDEFMYKNAQKNAVTQGQIANAIGYKQPSISNAFKKIFGTLREYRGNKFKIVEQCKGGFKACLVGKCEDTNFKSQNHNKPQNENISVTPRPEIRLSHNDEELATSLYARTADSAIRVSRSVVALKTTGKRRDAVIRLIKQSIDKSHYIDIVKYDEGLYVLLQDSHLRKIPLNDDINNSFNI